MGIIEMANVTRHSLLNYQSALDTTSRNIANMNTEGYKRRRVDMTRYSIGFSRINGGLTENNIVRMRQRFVEDQLYMENERMGQYNMDEQILSRVEGIFGTGNSNGLTDLMNEFWNGWEDLANNPESQPQRTILRNKGVSIAHWFNRVHGDIKALKTQIREEIQDTVRQTNQYLTQLADLNKNIQLNQDNDMLDQRDIVLGKLSNLLDINIMENSDQSVVVSSGGQILVSRNSAYQLESEVTTTNGYTQVQIRRSEGNKVLGIETGKLGGQLTNHNQRINSYLADLNTLATSLSSMVNSIHSSGYDLSGNTGTNFFNPDITGAGDFSVSAEILSDSSYIATATTSGDPGNGDIALSIAALRDNTSMPGSVTLGEFYTILVGQIGQDVQNADFSKTNQSKVIQSLENQMEATSGVSIDEEMTNLLQFEQGYQAAAKMVNAIDDFAKTILNMV
ncbi:MAG: flagellar hook-associated protein FlgK [FCB group bacterium]|nr:flagellar hook-associated protein FlgK [FCB group bacterium]